MNHLIFLDPQTGDLEKIHSGVKSMVIKEFNPSGSIIQPVSRGDILYFSKNKEECTLRVRAEVKKVLLVKNHPGRNLKRILKEMQPKLQLTENQYNHWSKKESVLLIEFVNVQKMNACVLALDIVSGISDWIPFENHNEITKGVIKNYQPASTNHKNVNPIKNKERSD